MARPVSPGRAVVVHTRRSMIKTDPRERIRKLPWARLSYSKWTLNNGSQVGFELRYRLGSAAASKKNRLSRCCLRAGFLFMNAGPLLQTVAQELAGRIGGGNCGSEKATFRASRKESTSDLRCRNGARRWNRNLGMSHNLDPHSDRFRRQIPF